MVKIQIKSDLKHLTDIHELLNQLKNYLDIPINDKFILDLSNLKFVSPIGAISLLMLFEELVKLNNYNVVLPKDNKNLVTYIERINFFKYCPEKIVREFDEEYDIDKMSQRLRNDQRKVLLEITQIEEYDDIDILYDSVIYILNSHGMKSEQVTKMNMDRGWGLTDARDYSHEGAKETIFQIRTHKSLYSISKEEIEIMSEDNYFPGTYFLIEIVF